VTSPTTPPGSKEPNAPKELKGGRYALLRKLGEGSQGETYEAIDNGVAPAARQSASRNAALADRWARFVREQQSGGEVPQDARLVAIKCFRLGTAKAWKDVELAEREARTLSSLDHPRLPRYFEHFEEDGALYLVMEKIEGESLAAIRANGRTMSVADVTKMLEDIADALRYLHGRAPLVVHRDIKPGNVIRKPDGSFALVDFGAVRDRLKPAGGSTVVGTFGYMAPEQFQGRASPKSDVYGVAATAMTMLTGTEPEDLPHEGLGIDVERALPRGTPASLVRALSAMLVPDPDGRIDTVDEALVLLREDRSAKGKRREKRRERDEPTGGRRSNRKQQRALKKQREAARREERKRGRALAPARRPHLLPRMVGRLGLFVALLVVWLTVGFTVPVALILLSLLFGGSLRRAAAACVAAAKRSQAALGRASMWLSGHRDESAALTTKLRVATEPERVRAAIEHDVEAPAEEADAWMEERLEKEAQRERMRLHAKPPGKRRYWGR
jgi:serine/threonine protein kinase